MPEALFEVLVHRDDYPAPAVGDREIDEEIGPIVVSRVARYDDQQWLISYSLEVRAGVQRSRTEKDKEAERRAADSFSIARAKAINSYAGLEQSLAGLFCTLLGTDHRKAYAVFARLMTGTSRRLAIGKLIEIACADSYDDFAPSLMDQISSLEAKRNKIVHWVALHSHKGGKKFRPDDIALHEHPDMFADGKLSKKEIDVFDRKADFLRLLTFYFDMHLKMGVSMDIRGKTPWREIFRQPVSYPPKPVHPLYREHKVP